MANEKEEDFDEIKKDFDKSSEILRKQITGIELKQQDLQRYITTIDNSISHLEQIIHYEENKSKPAYDKIKGLRAGISKNIELLSVLYNTYKEFEGIKFRYFKEIDDSNYKKHRLIELELKKVNQNASKLGEEFYNIMRNLSTVSSSDNNIIYESDKILENDEYTL